MKTNLKITTLSTAILVTLYAVWCIVRKCCVWSGVHFWMLHPIRDHIVGQGIDWLIDLCIAIFLGVLWTNRNRVPRPHAKWKSMRYLLVFSLGYLLIFQIQMICHYPMWCSRIFIYTLWLLPMVYAVALWMFCGQIGTAETYSLSKSRASFLLLSAVLLATSVLLGFVLITLWYYNATEWSDRWHWRIPLIISVAGKIALIFFLIGRDTPKKDKDISGTADSGNSQSDNEKHNPRITLTAQNFSSYLPLDIAAFSYAFPGAMGEGGAIEIVTTEGASYYLNYVKGDLSDSQLEQIIPILPELHLPLVGETDQVPEGWKHISLGAGNNLLVRTQYVEQFLFAWETFHKNDKRAFSPIL